MLQVKKIHFSYKNNPILNNISFEVNKGEHLSIIGESGSGKSTLLKLLYGELDADKGDIFWGNIQILGPKFNLVVGYEFIKYVAQEFDLMPFITVSENIGKHLSNFFPEAKKARISELLDVVELSNFANTKVKYLSGGQKQRVALARALAKEPEIILLDEPFSHIDNFKKQSLRRSLFKYLQSKNIACVVATHDKEDVLGFADRMLVLNENKIVANNSPESIFQNPKTSLIASFFGEFNILNNSIIYAHQLKIVDQSNIKVVVVQNYFKGSYYLIECLFNDDTIFFENSSKIEIGRSVYLTVIK